MTDREMIKAFLSAAFDELATDAVTDNTINALADLLALAFPRPASELPEQLREHFAEKIKEIGEQQFEEVTKQPS